MLPSTIGTFGGPKENSKPVENPRTQIDDTEYNKLLEYVAQMTRTATRAVVLFTTTAAAAVFTYSSTDIAIRTLWGSGDPYKPTISKTATGLYTVRFPSSFKDALGTIETLGFVDAWVSARTSDVTDDCHAKIMSVSANTVTIAVEEPRATRADTATSAELMDISLHIL